MDCDVQVNGEQVPFLQVWASMNRAIRYGLEQALSLKRDTQEECQVFVDEYCSRHEAVFGTQFRP